jgi:hypothetical protein
METFKKRQKEMKRLEKQRDKAARRLQRKENRGGPAEEAPLEEDAPKSESEPDGSPSIEPTAGL